MTESTTYNGVHICPGCKYLSDNGLYCNQLGEVVGLIVVCGFRRPKEEPPKEPPKDPENNKPKKKKANV